MNDLVLNIGDAMTNDSNQYLTFSVLKETMAISIGDVREIIEIGHMTRVPMSNPCVRGVINLRGNVVPVVDIGYRLHQQLLVIDKRSSIVLVEIQSGDESHSLGMLVDEVNEILEIEPQNMQKTPQFGAEIRSDFIRHMGRCGNEFIIVLNLSQVLLIEDLAATLGNPSAPKLVSVQTAD